MKFLIVDNIRNTNIKLGKLREKLGPVIRLGGAVGSASARRAGDTGSSPGAGENSHKLGAYVFKLCFFFQIRIYL